MPMKQVIKVHDTLVFRAKGGVYEGVVLTPWAVLKGYWVVEARMPFSNQREDGRWAVHESEVVVTS